MTAPYPPSQQQADAAGLTIAEFDAEGMKIQHAARRLQRLKAGERHRVVYGFDDEKMDDFMYRMLENAHTRDLQVLADAWLAAHALAEADEGPVDEAWLRSEGFVDQHSRWEKGRLRLTQYDGQFNAWLTFDANAAGAFRVIDNVSRRQVRLLLAALGEGTS